MSSRNKPHEIISGASWLAQFADGVITGLREHGVGTEAIHRLGTQTGTEEMERGITAFVEAITHSKDTDYLRFLQTITIAPTKGDVTLAEANDVFTRLLWIDDDLKNWDTNVPGEDTDEAAVDVYEMTHGGNFSTLFCSLGYPHKLCLTQGQIKEFCRSHRDLLRQERCGIFFLFEVKENLFVAFVFMSSGKLCVYMYCFDYNRFWRACGRHRLVVKQQTI